MTVIEKMARAIEEQTSREMEDDKPGLIDTTQIARAALKVILDDMAEPSEEMFKSALLGARFEVSGMRVGPGVNISGPVWSQMLTAYRKEALG